MNNRIFDKAAKCLAGLLAGGFLIFFPDATRQPEIQGHGAITPTISKKSIMRLKSQQKYRPATKLNDSEEQPQTDQPAEVNED